MAFLSRRPRTPEVTQPEVWAAVAESAGGEYLEAARRSSDRVVVQRGNWQIVLDKHIVSNGQYGTTVYTRVSASYLAEDDITLRMSRRRWYSRLVAPVAPPDVEIGDAGIEQKYVMRSRHAARVRSIMNERRVRDLILAQPSMRLDFTGLGFWDRRKLGSRVRRVSVRTTGVVMDPDRLLGFIDLVEALLQQLVRIGSASAAPVDPDRHNGELRRRL